MVAAVLARPDEPTAAASHQFGGPAVSSVACCAQTWLPCWLGPSHAAVSSSCPGGADVLPRAVAVRCQAWFLSLCRFHNQYHLCAVLEAGRMSGNSATETDLRCLPELRGWLPCQATAVFVSLSRAPRCGSICTCSIDAAAGCPPCFMGRTKGDALQRRRWPLRQSVRQWHCWSPIFSSPPHFRHIFSLLAGVEHTPAIASCVAYPTCFISERAE
jgi:hypothetical protein